MADFGQVEAYDLAAIDDECQPNLRANHLLRLAGLIRQTDFLPIDRLSWQSQWSPILRFFLAKPNLFERTKLLAFFCKGHPIEQDEYDKRETIPLATVT